MSLASSFFCTHNFDQLYKKLNNNKHLETQLTKIIFFTENVHSILREIYFTKAHSKGLSRVLYSHNYL